ncbi:hypothetical protein TNIN_140511 [Trichonephila inaurata madagascariensis]|uniref:Uncharacterized protein n=1 Tax=Trichonephila inaurata madagascariensis TaxID=2747483 RepID=A0A8X7CCE2_9ARAC|nr:hypothetical protein TNIN_140511 [Trichonephila inaurata madagascariensis]
MVVAQLRLPSLTYRLATPEERGCFGLALGWREKRKSCEENTLMAISIAQFMQKLLSAEQEELRLVGETRNSSHCPTSLLSRHGSLQFIFEMEDAIEILRVRRNNAG